MKLARSTGRQSFRRPWTRPITESTVAGHPGSEISRRSSGAGTAATLYEAAAAFCTAAFATGLLFYAAAFRTAAHLFLVAAMMALRPAALSLRFFGAATPCD